MRCRFEKPNRLSCRSKGQNMGVNLQDKCGARRLLKLKFASVLVLVVTTFSPLAASQVEDSKVAGSPEPQLVVDSSEVVSLLTYSDIEVDVVLTNASSKPVRRPY